jgi:TonB family protein
MTLTTKNSPELNGPGKAGASSSSSAGKAGQSPRSNPVCLEVNVTIRSLPGETSGLTQPIREDARTVIVFDNGAVLRSSNNMPAGLKVILSNPKGRDVACHVVSGRNLPNVKGYVEVEFLEPVNDFWSIHQEAGRDTAALPPAAPPAPREAVAPPPPVPAMAPRAPAPMEPPSRPVSTSLGSAPTIGNVAGRAGIPAAAATRDLKSETARPPEERVSNLSSYYSFSETAKATSLANWNATTSEPPAEKIKIPAKREASSLASPPAAPAHDFLSKGLMGYEQPAESSGGSSGRMALIVGVGALALAAACGIVFYLRRSPAPIPIAKTVAVSQPATPEPLTANSAPAPAQAPPAEEVPIAAETQMQPQPVVADPAKAMDSAAPVPAVVTSPATSDSRKETRPDAKSARRTEKKEVAAKQPETAPMRRPLIPNLKMSSPSAPNQNLAKLGEASASATDIASAATVGTVPSAGLLTSAGRISNPPAPPAPAFAPASSAPAAAMVPAPAPAPVPAVKSVREPKLISSTRAIYPATARESNIQGIVTVSASIDANGKVVAAKALSGPVLLRQAAVDSVSQWKYSPGLIDGKPAPSQVSVSVEFRLN